MMRRQVHLEQGASIVPQAQAVRRHLVAVFAIFFVVPRSRRFGRNLVRHKAASGVKAGSHFSRTPIV